MMNIHEKILASDDIKRRVLTGCTLVCVGVPSGTEFGFDLSIHNVGPKFMGLKMIPVGLHFATTRPCAANYGEFSSMKSGFFVRFTKPGQVIVRKWDEKEEAFLPLEVVDEEEHGRFESAVKRFELDGALAPMSLEKHNQWCRLTRHIDDATLERIEGTNGKILHFMGMQDDHEDVEYEHYSKALIKILSSIPQARSLKGEALTRACMDKSKVLEAAMEWAKGESSFSLLGQLQADFVMFLIGESYESLEVWKTLINVCCNCEEEMQSNPAWMAEFISVLRQQLKQIPQDMFVDPITSGNFLGSSIKTLLEIVDEYDPPLVIQQHSKRLVKAFKRRFGYDPSPQRIVSLDEYDENDEDAPVIVHLEENNY